MRHIHFRAIRLWAVSAAIELLTGVVLFVFSQTLWNGTAKAAAYLSLLLILGGTLLLALARVPMKPLWRRVIGTLGVLPLWASLFVLPPDPLREIGFGLIGLGVLFSVWVLEGRTIHTPRIWADLSATVLSLILVGVSVRMLVTPSAFEMSNYHFIAWAPAIVGLLALGGAVVLLAPLVGHEVFVPWSFPWRISGGLVPLLLLVGSLLAGRYVSVVFWALWSLLILRGFSFPWLSAGSDESGDIAQLMDDQLLFTERTLEIWLWAGILMVMAVVILGDGVIVWHRPAVLFTLVMSLYSICMHLVFPDLGSTERRVFAHLLILTLGIGALLLDPQPLFGNFLVVLALTPFLGARVLGVKSGVALLALALLLTVFSALIGGAGRPWQALSLGMTLVKAGILSLAGWMGIQSAVEQRRLVGELAEAREAQRKQIEELERIANYDSLTGLFNRRRFREELEKQLTYVQRRNGQGALFFIDLDGFKYVNDSLGHQAGDELLKVVAELLRTHVRDRDIVCRLGGDEFAVILPGASRETAVRVANRLLQASREKTMFYEGHHIRITPSIGIVLYPEHGTTVDELTSHADVAMYEVKENGRNGVHVFVPDNSKIGAAKLAWEKRIREALEEDKFVLYAQPVYHLQTGRIAMYELLLRMQGDHGELILPGAFLNVAERFGLIHDIDRWVLRKAIMLMAQYKRELQHTNITINLSGKSLGDPELLPLIRRELTATGVDPRNIVIEITETAAIQDPERVVNFINTLRDIGFRFAVDDFGSGYSTFFLLKKLNVDYLKIDGNFVRDLPEDETDVLFIRSIVQIAQGLRIQTIAEFVENAETVAVLRQLGVTHGQGYYLGPPRPVHEVLPVYR